ncbi:MAG: hypothetical protein U0270_31030 [Labilithrix sp.]
MLKGAFAVAAVWIAVVAPSTSLPPGEAPLAPAAAACTPAEKCCKVCDVGQACGKTCISKSKTCHVGRGCACNASEVCRANE